MYIFVPRHVCFLCCLTYILPAQHISPLSWPRDNKSEAVPVSSRGSSPRPCGSQARGWERVSCRMGVGRGWNPLRDGRGAGVEGVLRASRPSSGMGGGGGWQHPRIGFASPEHATRDGAACLERDAVEDSCGMGVRWGWKPLRDPRGARVEGGARSLSPELGDGRWGGWQYLRVGFASPERAARDRAACLERDGVEDSMEMEVRRGGDLHGVRGAAGWRGCSEPLARARR